MLDKINNSESNFIPSEFKNPFNKDSIDRVYYEFHRSKSMFRKDCFHKASIYLKQGNTSGTQEFFDDDPEKLRKKVENFINNLK